VSTDPGAADRVILTYRLRDATPAAASAEPSLRAAAVAGD
jgi:hypothetical protein